MVSKNRPGHSSFVPATTKKPAVNLANEKKKFPEFHKPSGSAIRGARAGGMSGGGLSSMSRRSEASAPVAPPVLDRSLSSSTEIMASSIESRASEA